MTVRRTCSTDAPPDDPVGAAVAATLNELVGRAAVEVSYTPISQPPPPPEPVRGWRVLSSATAEVLDGWRTTIIMRVEERGTSPAKSTTERPKDPLVALPVAGLRAADELRGAVGARSGKLSPSIQRALRDSIVVELLGELQGFDGRGSTRLLAETLEYLIELSGTRVESKHLTHGVVITDALTDEPRLSVPYPSGLRNAKRSPLLFDGQRAVLIVDESGRARTELQRHRLEKLVPSHTVAGFDNTAFVDSGSLVSLATQRLGGIGLFLREDRSIWTFVDGRPLVVRRGEHWTAFPVRLASAIGDAIGNTRAVELVVEAALMISVQPNGAILGIVDSAASLDGTVARKDRYDLRNEFDPPAMRAETRLHHLIDAVDMDAQTLARLAALDGATILDREGRLLAYGAIVASADSQHEGARTAAARTLSERVLAVLKVSEDGEITVFRDGVAVTSLLRSGGTHIAV